MTKVVWIFFAVATLCKPPSRYAQNDKINLCHTYKSCHTDLPYRFVFPCHTERNEVSINLKCVLNSLDISLTLNMTNRTLKKEFA